MIGADKNGPIIIADGDGAPGGIGDLEGCPRCAESAYADRARFSVPDGRLVCPACSPDAAIISVGAHNFYGHPAPATLDRLNSYGCEVFRTDEANPRERKAG